MTAINQSSVARLVPLLALLVALWGLPRSASAEPAATHKPRPNVLFIAIDDLRPMLGCYGNTAIKSPCIDRLAQRGTVFTKAYCQAAQCGPSRASVMTGLRPDATGEYVMNFERFSRKNHPGLVTLPQHFKQNGYTAQAFGKIYHDGQDDAQSWSVSSSPGRQREMWEAVDEQAITGVPFEERASIPTVIKPRRACNAIQSPEVPDDTLYAGRMTRQAIEAMAALKHKPFFLAVGYRRPHLPFVAPQRYFDLYPLDQIALPANRQPPVGAPPFAVYNSWVYGSWAYGKQRPKSWIAGPHDPPYPATLAETARYAGFEMRSYLDIPSKGPISDQRQKEIRQAYMACISYVDAQIGQLLKGLQDNGVADNTIVALWSDHGWHLGEQGTWSKMTNYEWATRVPLIVAAPQSDTASAQSSALVELVDVYPTLCDLAGLEIPEHVQGTSLAPVMRNPQQSWKTGALSQFPFGRNIMGRAIRTQRYRYVAWLRKDDELLAAELYDHQTDPNETVNCYGREETREVSDRLHRQLMAGWRASGPAE